MMTVGMVTALALVGGHAAVARAIWPGERVEDPGPALDPYLKAQAGALSTVVAIKERKLSDAHEALAAARKRETALRVELDAAKAEARELVDERSALRREVRRLRRVEVLAAVEGDGEGDETAGDDDGSAAPPAGPRPFQ